MDYSFLLSFLLQVSEQVRRELRTLLYGREQAEETELPDSLLQWLSTQFVSSTDLQASLTALERSILGNVSLQLEMMQQKPSAETVTQAVRKTTEQAGLSEEVKECFCLSFDNCVNAQHSPFSCFLHVRMCS